MWPSIVMRLVRDQNHTTTSTDKDCDFHIHVFITSEIWFIWICWIVFMLIMLWTTGALMSKYHVNLIMRIEQVHPHVSIIYCYLQIIKMKTIPSGKMIKTWLFLSLLSHIKFSLNIHVLCLFWRMSEWTGLTFISSLELYTTVVVRSVATGPDTSQVLHTSTPTYHATDKHDTPPSHFKLTLGQPALLKALYAWWMPKPGKQQVPIFSVYDLTQPGFEPSVDIFIYMITRVKNRNPKH